MMELTTKQAIDIAQTELIVTRLDPLQRAELILKHPTDPGKSLRGTLNERPDGAWDLELQRLSVQVKGSRVPLQIHVVAETQDGASAIFKALAQAIAEGAV